MISSKDIFGKIFLIMLIMPFLWSLHNLEQWFAFSNKPPQEILLKGGFFVKKLEPVIHLGFSNIMRNILLTSSLIIFLLSLYSIYSKSKYSINVFKLLLSILIVNSIISVITALFSNLYIPGLISSIVGLLPYSILSILYLKKVQMVTIKEMLVYYLPLGLIIYYPLIALIWYVGVQISTF